jgi:hypothetical protein
VNSALIDIDVAVDNNCYIRTPIKYRDYLKFLLMKINYFLMNCESIQNVIVDSVAQFSEIIIVDSQNIDS